LAAALSLQKSVQSGEGKKQDMEVRQPSKKVSLDGSGFIVGREVTRVRPRPPLGADAADGRRGYRPQLPQRTHDLAHMSHSKVTSLPGFIALF
jgi:hypothetical protein